VDVPANRIAHGLGGPPAGRSGGSQAIPVIENPEDFDQEQDPECRLHGFPKSGLF